MTTTTDRAGDWMQTQSGKKVYPFDPLPDEIDLEDIAHALAHICRFAGHVRHFHSVAFHSVLVSELVGTLHPQIARAALYHDAAEAYTADIPRPVKRNLLLRGESLTSGTCGFRIERFERFDAMEERLLRVIFTALGIPWPNIEEWKIIHRADDAVLRAEAEQLMPDAAWALRLPEPPIFLRIPSVDPMEARRRFSVRNAHLLAMEAAA